MKAARAAVAVGDAGDSSAALEDALRRELEKWPGCRDRAVLEEIVTLANAIVPSAGGRAASRLSRVLADAEQALRPAAVAPSAPTPPVRSAGRAPAPDASSPNEVLTARLDAFEQHIRWLESALGELRDRELPELRALAAGRAQVGEPEPVASMRTEGLQPAAAPRAAARGSAGRAQDCARSLRSPQASGVAEAGRPCPFPPATGGSAGHARAAARAARPRLGGGNRDLLGIVFISILAADRGWVSAELRVVLGASSPRRSTAPAFSRTRVRPHLGRSRRGWGRASGARTRLSPPRAPSTTSSGSRRPSSAPRSSRPSAWSPRSGGTRR